MWLLLVLKRETYLVYKDVYNLSFVVGERKYDDPPLGLVLAIMEPAISCKNTLSTQLHRKQPEKRVLEALGSTWSLSTFAVSTSL